MCGISVLFSIMLILIIHKFDPDTVIACMNRCMHVDEEINNSHYVITFKIKQVAHYGNAS